MNHQERDWRRVTPQEPCVGCGGPDWCSRHKDGLPNVCRRGDFPGAVARTDRNGVWFWIDKAKGNADQVPAAYEPEPSLPLAGPDQLHRAYSELLAHLGVSPGHRRQLEGRGFTRDQIEKMGVKSLGRTDRATAQRLAELFPWWQHVPGLVLKNGKPTLAGWNGLLIPCRDLQGRIVGLQVRADSIDAPKYSWLSSAKHGGPGPGAVLSLWPAGGSDCVRVCEGSLKSARAAFRTGVCTVCAPGVALFGSHQMVDWLLELQAEVVLLAPDADFRTNRHVREAVRHAVSRLQAVPTNFEIRVEVWEPSAKGIDDALQGGLSISTISAEEFLQMTAQGDSNESQEGTGHRSVSPAAWEPPIPIQATSVRPTFPVKALPPALANYVESVALSFQVPVDLVAMSALAVVATTLQKRVDIDVGKGAVFPLNIWTLAIYPSGGGKSRVLSELRFPIEGWEQRLQEKTARDNDDAKDVAAELTQQTSDLLKIRDRTEAQEAELRSLRARIREAEEKPLPELFCSDLTPESLEQALGQNHGRMSIFNAEASDFFQVMAGRYSKDGNSSFGNFLSAYSQETIRTRRVIRGSSYIHKPTLTMGLAIQPTVFERIAANREFVTRGLPARFLIAYPVDLRGRREVDPPDVSLAARADYNAVIRALSLIEPSYDSKGQPEPFRLEFKMQARQEYLRFARWAEASMNGEGELAENKEFASRLREHLAKVIGILHCVANPGQPWETTIEPATVRTAEEIVRWSTEHVQSILGVGQAADLMNRAAYLCERIREQKDWQIQGTFSLRALQQLVKRKERYKAGGTKALESDLEFLEELGYLQKLESPKGSKSKIYRLSPFFSSSKSVPNDHTPGGSHIRKGSSPGAPGDPTGPQVPNVGCASAGARSSFGAIGVPNDPLGPSVDTASPRGKAFSHKALLSPGDIGDHIGQKTTFPPDSRPDEVASLGNLF